MSFVWDPPKNLLELPTGQEIRLYGVLFALGAWIAWMLIRKGLKSLFMEKGEAQVAAKLRATKLLDKLTWLAVVLIVFGARFIHLLFYDREYFFYDPLSIFRIWEAGLASHGGTLGGFMAVTLFWTRCRDKFLGASFLEFFDRFLPPIAITATFIRLGNFFNQEILGSPTSLPWGITFLHPVDGGEIVARHPVQLYEAIFYFATFFILKFVARKSRQPGFISGLFFLLVFGGRSFLELWKDSQNGLFDGAYLSTGQLLSLPLILFGIFLMFPRKESVIKTEFQ
jgi:prolipoprotein diacylglyceryl transferase